MNGQPFFSARPSAIETAGRLSSPKALHCMVCDRKLTADEKAINLKLISRTVTTFYCLDCLGQKLGCGREPIEERIRYFRESGECTLFR